MAVTSTAFLRNFVKNKYQTKLIGDPAFLLLSVLAIGWVVPVVRGQFFMTDIVQSPEPGEQVIVVGDDGLVDGDVD